MNVLVFYVIFLALTGYSRGDAVYCLCKNCVGEEDLMKALNWACGHGADCGPIQQNGPCFKPNTLKDHCNYAVNSYYHKMQSVGGTCDFAGVATITSTPPFAAFGCAYPSTPRCDSPEIGITPGTSSPSTPTSPSTPGTGTGTSPSPPTPPPPPPPSSGTSSPSTPTTPSSGTTPDVFPSTPPTTTPSSTGSGPPFVVVGATPPSAAAPPAHYLEATIITNLLLSIVFTTAALVRI